MSSIEIKNLVKTYRNNDSEIRILSKLNLRFINNRKYAILGPSGCGKTTLLNIIAGIDRDYDGDVFFNSFNLRDLSNQEISNYKSSEVSFIHQNSTHFDKLSIIDNLELSSYLVPNDNNYNLKSVNVKASKYKTINKLSGGEKQRIGILRSISSTSKILLADEPTASLDYKNANTIMNILCNNAKGKIFIFVTHDEELANTFADEILYMKDGKITKNYKGKLNEPDYPFPTEKRKVSFKRALSFAFKLMKSQRAKTSIFISSFISSLLCLGFAVSLTKGFTVFFERQIKETTSTDTIYLNNKRSLLELDSSDYESLSDDCPTLNIKYCYDNPQTSNIISIYTDDNKDELLELDDFPLSSLLNSPKKTSINLKDDEIILSYNDEGEESLLELFTTDDLDDYISENTFYLSIVLGSFSKTLTIKELLYNTEVDNFTIYHSSSIFNKTLLGDNFTYSAYIDNSSLNEEEIDYLNSSSYCFFEDSNGLKIMKPNKSIVSIKELNQYSSNVIPQFYTGASYYLDSIGALSYFTNTTFCYSNLDITKTIYFSSASPELKLGRYPQPGTNEVLISSLLADEINFNIDNKSLKGCFKDQNFELNIVGVSNNIDTCFIYQDKAWAYNYFLENLSISQYLLPIESYELIVDSDNTRSILNTLKNIYTDYDVYSLVDEVFETLESVLGAVNIGFYCLIGINLLIAFASILVLSYLEIIDYDKQFKLLYSFGWTHKDINLVWLLLTVIRSIITIILSIVMCSLLCNAVNVVFDSMLSTSGGILIISTLVPSSIILATFLVALLAYLISSSRIKKIYK